MPRLLCRLAAFLLLLATLTLLVGATAVGTDGDAPFRLPPPSAPAPQTSAAAMILMDADGGAVLAQKNAAQRLPMARACMPIMISMPR